MLNRSFLLLSGCALLLAGSTSCRKSTSAEPAPPEVGWSAVEGADYSCYLPPNFAEGNSLDRSRMREEVLSALVAQLRGEVDPSFQMEDDFISTFEFGFLARPEKIEAWSDTIYQRCLTAGSGSALRSYLLTVPEQVQAGECSRPFIYEVHDILDIASGWQSRYHMCEGDRIQVSLTRDTGFAVSDESGPFDVLGHPEGELAGDRGPAADQPWGAILLRFEPDAGGEPWMESVGYDREFTAPAHGHISFTINDSVYYDNSFQERNGVIDYIAVDIYTLQSDQ